MPRAPIPEQPDRSLCRAMMCGKTGTKACTRCLGAIPRPKYCSKECQRRDWQFHKKYCGKKVYTFTIELLGSTNPVIKRTVDVPSWYTFQYFHFVIQYAFGPWEQCHLHEFSYSTAKANRSGGISLDADESVLKIIAEGEEPEMPLFGGRRPTPTYLYEKEVKLSDMCDEAGKHRALASKRGEVLPLTYVYDFGDNWEHLIKFKEEKMATTDRPMFSRAIGYPPAEDAGGVTGWEEVKDAFAAAHPTPDQIRRRQWAIERMGYKDRNDPLSVGEKAYSPFNEVNVTVMNYEGRWENHLEGYREQLGEVIERPNYADDDDIDSDESELLTAG